MNVTRRATNTTNTVEPGIRTDKNDIRDRMMINVSIFDGEVIATIHGSTTEMEEDVVIAVVSTFSSSSSSSTIFRFLVHIIHILDAITTPIVQNHLLHAMSIN
jgi:hypothetical protein